MFFIRQFYSTINMSGIADLRCDEVKYSSIQPTLNIHPFMQKWAHSYWTCGHGRRSILTVAVYTVFQLSFKYKKFHRPSLTFIKLNCFFPLIFQPSKKKPEKFKNHCAQSIRRKIIKQTCTVLVLFLFEFFFIPLYPYLVSSYISLHHFIASFSSTGFSKCSKFLNTFACSPIKKMS